MLTFHQFNFLKKKNIEENNFLQVIQSTEFCVNKLAMQTRGN